MNNRASVGAAVAVIVMLATMSSSVARSLTFEERVKAQEAIERVYYSHQLGATKPFAAAVTREAIERKVSSYLAREADLVAAGHAPITADQLRGEVNRIASSTRMPDRLRELYAALGDDPVLIAETVARMALIDRAGAGTGADAVSNAATDPCQGNNFWESIADAPLAQPNGYSGNAVWTGNLALIWGVGGGLAGLRYDPVLDTWSSMSAAGSPEERGGATTVWTGSEMIVWGGWSSTSQTYFNSGASYEPVSDTWRSTSLAGAPAGRSSHTAVWTGSRMIVFGGGAPSPPGGFCGVYYKDGGRYDPATDTWEPISPWTSNGRSSHVAVWTGSRMIVWGGSYSTLSWPEPPTCTSYFAAGGARYDPATDTWSPMTNVAAPWARTQASAVWTGSEFVVWGGYNGGPRLNTGGRYDPVADLWRPTSTVNAPTGRSIHGAVWTGTKMVVWGGWDFLTGYAATGGIYDPVADVWNPTSMAGAPTARRGHVQLWTGSDVLVWGGTNDSGGLASGARLVFGRPDADDDGVADACDPCPHDPYDDGDADGLCADVDNCPTIANPAQANGDGDAYGDVCDACLLDNPNDVDRDGVCTSVDNCPTVANADQLDSDADRYGNVCDNCSTVANRHQFDGDADGRGDRCDNCPTTSNASQEDGDGDGAGNACDCQPFDVNDRKPVETLSLAIGKTGSTGNLSWGAVPNADGYSVSRGDLSAKGPGQYGSCLVNGLVATGYDDPIVPAPGQGFFYMVQAQNFECGLGSLGTMSGERTRVNVTAGACAGVTVTDSHASAQSKIYGTISGTLANTFTTDQVYQTFTEVLSTGGSAASKFSRLEERFTVSVAAGTRKELHVAGSYINSLDGDDFRFEYSTDGTTFTPLSLSLLLNSNSVDRLAVLPGNLSGTVTIRVVDTDRTAGHQDLDVLYIDELWIRSIP